MIKGIPTIINIFTVFPIGIPIDTIAIPAVQIGVPAVAFAVLVSVIVIPDVQIGIPTGVNLITIKKVF